MKVEDKGGQRLRRKLADPAYAGRIAEIREGMGDMDKSYAMNLAVIRKAAQLTQKDLATRLGKGQAAVSKLERQHDLLLSTLASYISRPQAPKRNWLSPSVAKNCVTRLNNSVLCSAKAGKTPKPAARLLASFRNGGRSSKLSTSNEMTCDLLQQPEQYNGTVPGIGSVSTVVKSVADWKRSRDDRQVQHRGT